MRLARTAGVVGSLLCALPAHAETLTDDQASALQLEASARQHLNAMTYALRVGLTEEWVTYCMMKVAMEIAPESTPSNLARADLSKVRERSSFEAILKTKDDYMAPAITLCLANASNAIRAAAKSRKAN